MWSVDGMTLLDLLLIFGYLSIYMALWGVSVAWVRRRTAWPLSLIAPPLWVAAEFVRGHFFFLSFPFMLLGHSQYQFTSLIQITSIVGTYGLSFLIVLVNAVFAEILQHLIQTKASFRDVLAPPRSLVVSLTMAFLVLIGTMGYGVVVLSDKPDYDRVRVALIQGNTPRFKQWKSEYRNEILTKHADLTRQVLQHDPGLVVWGESAVPADVQHNLPVRERVSALAKEIGRYLLVGSAEWAKFDNTRGRPIHTHFYNSMVMFSPEGVLEDHYRKIKLIPFGEYVPLKEYVRWPKALAPTMGLVRHGTELTIFNIGNATFATMICWEVMYPELFRDFVRRGAGFILSGYNAAPFKETAVTYQYLAVSVVLAAQHRRAFAGVGNTGLTAFVDPYGTIGKRLSSPDGRELFVEGVLVDEMSVVHDMTFYTRYGEVFAFLQLAICVLLLLAALFKNRVLVSMRQGSPIEP
jgi:apolipoprotein N-acyltransferase